MTASNLETCGRLKDKIAVVTGAGQGIGKAIVQCFSREGAHVWATSRREEPMADLAKLDRVRILGLDVTRATDVAKAADRIGHADILVNCAGFVANGPLHRCTEADLERSWSVNVHGAYLMIRAFLDTMRKRRSGSIINIASVLSSVSSAPGRFAYGTSKGALIGMTKSIAVDYAAEGIRCNAICPGAVDTPGLKTRIDAGHDPSRIRQQMIDRHKIGRLGTAEEIAEACVYLASDHGSFMTGQLMVIDGGMTI